MTFNSRRWYKIFSRRTSHVEYAKELSNPDYTFSFVTGRSGDGLIPHPRVPASRQIIVSELVMGPRESTYETRKSTGTDGKRRRNGRGKISRKEMRKEEKRLEKIRRQAERRKSKKLRNSRKNKSKDD